jgi:2-polyprenyl-3-methyl-5-hydroxy-6-metoxy-1,4-benzoquinol methylase
MKASNIASPKRKNHAGAYQMRHDRKSSHRQIASLVRALNRAPILDVGAAEGLLGRQLSARGDCENLISQMDAVELNPEWAENARPFYREVFATSIEDAPLEENKYRVIVCGDVLEHVVDPPGVLRALKQAATPDAHFIISLPNIAHITIRLMLLSGQFPQMEKGILDKTHLHFYTQKTAREMLESAGLKVERVLPTVVPLEIWFQGALQTGLKRSQYAALNLAPNLFAYQWIFVARSMRSSADTNPLYSGSE